MDTTAMAPQMEPPGLGSSVLYVLPSGEARPADVVAYDAGGRPNLLVKLNGPGDNTWFPGHTGTVWQQAVPYGGPGQAGTWY